MDKFSALAEPTRRTILEMLARHGQMPAAAIYAGFSISHPAISQHLKVLREAGLVQMEKRAQQHIYKLNPEAMTELEAWARRMRDLWEERFEALDKVLEAEKNKLLKEKENEENPSDR
jgi:DNA-binding transcriptional ArsR family regulator